jgi:8-oxo-dGTP pyrophosphatase MutT (NUDIX family)
VTEPVLAAGGVPVRGGGDGLQVLVVHRRRYEDWTFPKGKCKTGESDEQCALREVAEETGLACALEDELPVTWYTGPGGRQKRVRWWRMRVVDGELALPPGEIDDARWVTLDEAAALLTYERDLQVLRRV